ncbi:hypothetical protein CALVIDRAFT_569600 [Calocera viscosa TUFC12733]|uniref:AB hydrolase-1 domain-containing protein n=1 Tax=Calocera viscosa (strain TUFC12733) TaxID=1330018 RepID=A0A167FTT6_CALVF|nr:hypothetical protein CALVIDRAFT_569600 [Calocera viscosa TUFC12733]
MLFINPGGPGGSGTAAVVSSGPVLNKILKGRYDILSWDPRGVNMTTPPLECYPTEYDEYMSELLSSHVGLPFQARGEGGDDAELALLKKVDAYYRSAFVVRDMVRILEAIGEDERGLQYWGFSYGTILGATFSAMFPDKVHRVLLDGVSSARLYTTDMFDWGRSGMDDTNKVWTGFLSSCAKAGPDRCTLAKGNDTESSIRQRFDKMVDSLIEQPVRI